MLDPRVESNAKEIEKLKKISLKIADRLKELGSKYYNKEDRTETAIFWELEGVFRAVAKESC